MNSTLYSLFSPRNSTHAQLFLLLAFHQHLLKQDAAVNDAWRGWVITTLYLHPRAILIVVSELLGSL